MAARLAAIDTSTERLVLAVQGPVGTVTLDEPGGPRASTRLLPALVGLLREAGMQPADLDAIAFAQGPGAFTGLRVACATAQGLALGLGRPLLPLDSLLLVADAARAQAGGDAWWVAMDARMDEVYAASYRWVAARWRTLQAPALWTLEALRARWVDAPPAAVAGSAPAAFEARLPVPADAACIDPAARAAALLRLAQAAWADGAAIDPGAALPLYLRDRVALTTAERAAAATAR